MAPIRYALQGGGTTDELIEGQNVIGRSSVPVEGVAFINIDSPRSAISRMQAFIDIAPNGDAWLSDCDSTNGTVLSVRPGTGKKLEPNRYYQLSEGCTIVFGDVEKSFIILPAERTRSKEDATTPAASARTKTRSSSQLAQDKSTNEGSAEVRRSVSGKVRSSPRSGNASKTKLVPASQNDAEQAAGDVPYLLTEQPAKDEIAPVVPSSPPARKRGRADERPATPRASAKPMTVCLSGMDEEKRGEVKKWIRRRSAKLVDDITAADVLVVATPATRTPKFIIAVGRGIPVVSDKVLELEELTPSSLEKYIVSLKHNGVSYSAASLKKVMYREDSSPLLAGRSFRIQALPAKSRPVVDEIVRGCGGSIVREAGKDGVVELPDETEVNALYHAILTGTRRD